MELIIINKLLFVDCLRGFAILGVLLVHCGQQIKLPDFLANIAAQGQMGVQLFFIASSFTLFLSYKNRLINKEKNINYNFFIRRFFRIAPMFYITMCFYLTINLFTHKEHFDMFNIITHITFINGLFPEYINSIVPGGWSVAIEMIFYLFVPLAFKYIDNIKKAFVVVIVTIIISYLQNIFLIDFYNKNFVYFWFPNQIPIFALGFICYFVNDKKYLVNITPTVLSTISIFLMILIAQITQYINNVNHILYGILFVLFFYSLSLQSTTIFVNKFIAYLGKISYSIYLTHFAILKTIGYLFKKYLPHSFPILEFVILFLVVLLISSVISSITYKYIEKQGIEFGKNILNTFKKNTMDGYSNT